MSTVSENSLLVLDSVAGLTQLSAMSGGKPIGILMPPKISKVQSVYLALS